MYKLKFLRKCILKQISHSDLVGDLIIINRDFNSITEIAICYQTQTNKYYKRPILGSNRCFMLGHTQESSH